MMGTETLNEVQEGDQILLETGNSVVRALEGDVVPRGTDGAATSGAGSLGTAQYPFRQLHIRDLIINGQPVSLEAEQTAAQLFANGVVRGMAPTGRPGMCGWMNEAQASGITLHASETEPLVVRVGGREYSLTADITGGTPPATFGRGFYQTSSYSPSPGDTVGPEAHERGQTPGGINSRYTGFTGAPLHYDSTTNRSRYPSQFGHNVIVRVAGDGLEYIPAEVGPDVNTLGTTIRMLRNSMNQQANTGYSVDSAKYSTARSFTHATLAYVFVDPTETPWSIMQETEVLGAIEDVFPTGSAGQILFRTSNSKWYRFESGNWTEKEWVMLGISATYPNSSDVNITQAVLGARTEDSLAKLRPLARLLHSEGGVWDRSRNAYYTPTRSGNNITWAPPGSTPGTGESEERGPQNYISQTHQPQAPRYTIDTQQRLDRELASHRSGEGQYNVWVSAEDGNAFSDLVVPNLMELASGQVVMIHPHQNAVWIGSYAVDNNNDVSNRITLPTDTIAVGPNANAPGRFNPAIWFTGFQQVEPFGQASRRFRIGIQGQDDEGGNYWLVGSSFGRSNRTIRIEWFSGPFTKFRSQNDVRNPNITLQMDIMLPTLGDIADNYNFVVE